MAEVEAKDAPKGTEDKPSEPSGVTRSVLRQIEYYFSDSNYPKDKFLMAEVAKDDEGWVSISVIANFNKVKGLVPSMDVAVIADALRHSTFLHVAEDGTKVRRPSLVKKTVKLGALEFHSRDELVTHARALISEGDAADGGAIPEEGQAFVNALLDLHEKAAEKRGEGEHTIKVGRNPDYPDTSCFVIVRADGSEVDFSYLKCVEKIFPLPPKRDGGKPAGGAAGKKRKQEAANSSPSKKQAAEAGSSGEPKAVPAEADKGKIVVIKDLAEGLDFKAVKEKMGGDEAGCAFVEVVPDMPLAYVRFASAEQAKVALAIEGVGTCTLLEGDDERQYWEKIASGGGGRASGGKGGKGKGGKGKGKGKGGRGRGRGRGRK